jgi:hypothetical protein
MKNPHIKNREERLSLLKQLHQVRQASVAFTPKKGKFREQNDVDPKAVLDEILDRFLDDVHRGRKWQIPTTS